MVDMAVDGEDVDGVRKCVRSCNNEMHNGTFKMLCAVWF